MNGRRDREWTEVVGVRCQDRVAISSQKDNRCVDGVGHARPSEECPSAPPEMIIQRNHFDRAKQSG
jgi:hypothetical protein